MISATDAAFSGFRAGREHFRTLLLWIPILALVSVAMAAVMVTFGGPALMQVQAMGAQAETDPRAALEAMKPLGTFYLVLLPVMLLYYGFLYAAVNRMILRPGDNRMAYFGAGADEVRQVILMLAQGLVYLGVYLGGVIAVVVLAGALSAVNVGLGVAAGFLGALALIALLVAVRLSLASAQTFAERRINVFGSWTLTRGHFWPMLGAYLLSVILAMIAYAAVFAILALIMVIIGGGFSAMGAIVSPDMSSLQAYFTPTFIIYELLAAIPAPFLLLIFTCPAPEIYRQLAGAKGQAAAFE